MNHTKPITQGALEKLDALYKKPTAMTVAGPCHEFIDIVGRQWLPIRALIDQQARYIESLKADTSWRSEVSLTLQRDNEQLTKRIAELEAQVAEYARAMED